MLIVFYVYHVLSLHWSYSPCKQAEFSVFYMTNKHIDHVNTLSSECVKFKVSIFNMYKQAVLSVFYIYQCLCYENKLFHVFTLHWSYLTWYEIFFQIINENKLFDVFSLHLSYSTCKQAVFSMFFKYNVLHYENKLFNVFLLHWLYSPCKQAEFSLFYMYNVLHVQ